MRKLRIKAINFLKYFLFILFVGYYSGINFFYHSHIINGITISHSHPYLVKTDANGKPVKHSHSEDELVFIQMITHYLVMVVTFLVFLKLFLVLLYKYSAHFSGFIIPAGKYFAYPHRGPPLFNFLFLS